MKALLKTGCYAAVFAIACLDDTLAAQPAYERCGSGIRINCIVDGNTLWNNGIKIRIADIDTPEISQPRCAAEKALGERATRRMVELVNAGSPPDAGMAEA